MASVTLMTSVTLLPLSHFNPQSGHGLALTTWTAAPCLKHTASLTSMSFDHLDSSTMLEASLTSVSFPCAFLASLRMLMKSSCASHRHLRPPRFQPHSSGDTPVRQLCSCGRGTAIVRVFVDLSLPRSPAGQGLPYGSSLLKT